MHISSLVKRFRVEASKFGIIGLAAFIVDFGVFNLLLNGGDGILGDHPVTANIISGVTATFVAYFGNRYWTFRYRARSSFRQEYFIFFVLNAVALAIASICVAVSSYVFNQDSTLSVNIAKFGVGLPLGTIFRFWSYRKWVFKAHPEAPELITEDTSTN